MSHTCHAHPCDAPCPPAHLMCRKHWRMVPRDLAHAVVDSYTPGQCDNRRLITAEWRAAAMAAVRHVSEALAAHDQRRTTTEGSDGEG